MSQVPILKITYCLSHVVSSFVSVTKNFEGGLGLEISLKGQVSVKKCFRKREKEGKRERERELFCVFLKYNASTHSKLVLEIGFP